MGTIRIVEPADGAQVAAGSVTVRVAVEGIPPDEVHWHFLVDGQESGMISGLETEIELESGAHDLKAVLSSEEAHEIDPNAPQSEIHVTVGP